MAGKRAANGAGLQPRLRKDGRWEARYKVGYDPITGKPKYKYLYGKTEEEAKGLLKLYVVGYYRKSNGYYRTKHEKMAFDRQEAANYMGISLPVLDELLKREYDPIPYLRIGRRWVIPKELLDMWMRHEIITQRRGREHGRVSEKT